MLILSSVLLVLAVLIQNNKGGLNQNFTGVNNISQNIGVVRATEQIEKVTWYLMAALIVSTLLINISLSGGASGPATLKMQENISNQVTPAMPSNVPNNTTTAPKK